MAEQGQHQFDAEPAEENANADDGSKHGINLFVKSGRNGIGCCPFSQRLFMTLWLKGVVFKVTTLERSQIPKEIAENGGNATNPPYLWMNQELIDDVSKAEDYIEAELYLPKYPSLACRYPSSNGVCMDLFRHFSAWIKYKGNVQHDDYKKHYNKFYKQLKQLNEYLVTPLDDEIDPDYEGEQKSTRKFIDGDSMTLADCNILPKLNIIQVAGWQKYEFVIPEEFDGIHRYLAAARECDEFDKTCPEPDEVTWIYCRDSMGPKPKKH